MAEKKTVLSKKVVGRRHALADSDDSSTEYERELLLPANSTDFCRNCCSCNSRFYSKSRCGGEKQQSVSADSQLNRTCYREQLEMKVLNERVSLQVSSENFNSLLTRQDRLEEAAGVLTTLLDCLRLSSSCLTKFNRLILDSKTDFDQKSCEIFDKITEGLEIIKSDAGEDTDSDTTPDFCRRKSDLVKASNNFSVILKRSSVPSNKQLSKLERQYDEIRSLFVEARTKATLKINSSVQFKTESLSNYCQKILIPILTASSVLEKQLADRLVETNVDSIRKRLEAVRSLSSSGCLAARTDSSALQGAGDTANRRRRFNCRDSSI